jgi:hypothetical protein
MTKYLEEDMSFIQFLLNCGYLVFFVSLMMKDLNFLKNNYEEDSIIAGVKYRDDLNCMLELLTQIRFRLGYLPNITSQQLKEEKELELKNLTILSKTVFQYYALKDAESIGIDNEKGTALTNLIRNKYIQSIESICSHGIKFRKFDYRFEVWDVIEAFETHHCNNKDLKEIIKKIQEMKLKSKSLNFKYFICSSLKFGNFFLNL